MVFLVLKFNATHFYGNWRRFLKQIGLPPLVNV
jgi:hypothetical protein